MMAWFMMVVAGLFETGFAVLLNQSHGITRLRPTAGFAVCALISFGLLTMALKTLEVGSAYAVWTVPRAPRGHRSRLSLAGPASRTVAKLLRRLKSRGGSGCWAPDMRGSGCPGRRC